MWDARFWLVFVAALGASGACASTPQNTVPSPEGGGGEAGTGGSGGAGEVAGRSGEDGCTDGVRNGTESEVDCGGDCPACGADDLHCDNRVRDVDERDVDCGGNDCDRCAEGQECQIDQDCHSDACRRGQCVRLCDDTASCGGTSWCEDGSCRNCVDSDKCGSFSCAPDSTCACRAGLLACVTPGCFNGVEDSTESDVDCGGIGCKPCEPGLTCDVSEDCTTGLCMTLDSTSLNSQCLMEHCGNRKLDADETDVDCGGSDCAVCDQGYSCNVETDCDVFQECRDGVCVKPCTSEDDCDGGLALCEDGMCLHCEFREDCQGFTCRGSDMLICRRLMCVCVPT